MSDNMNIITAIEIAAFQKEHQQWIDNQGFLGEQATFYLKHFKSITFDQQWKQAVFYNCVFESCIFLSDFSEVDFSSSTFVTCKFEKTNLSYSRFSNATLVSSMFEDVLFQGSLLANTTIQKSCFEKVQGAEMDFSAALLQDVEMQNSDFSSTFFFGVVAEQLNVRKTTIDGADWRGAKLVNCPTELGELVQQCTLHQDVIFQSQQKQQRRKKQC